MNGYRNDEYAVNCDFWSVFGSRELEHVCKDAGKQEKGAAGVYAEATIANIYASPF